VAKSRSASAVNSIVLHAYCQHGEQGTLKSISGIFSALIKQLLIHLEFSGKAQSIFVVETLNKAHRQGRSSISPEEGVSMLLSIIKQFSEVFIIIDGIDECMNRSGHLYDNEDEAFNLLKTLRLLLRSPATCKIKLFLSSRMEVDVRRIFPSCQHVLLSQENVAQDIKIFVNDEVDGLLVLQKIWSFFVISKKD
jgi:hypothetical protein